MGFFVQGLPDRFKHFKEKNPADQAKATIKAIREKIKILNLEEINSIEILNLLEDLEFISECFMQDHKGW